MPKRTSKTGSELFIVDNSEDDWKVQRYLHDWCQLSKSIDVATGYFEIGGLLGLKDEWQKVDAIRILMGDEVSRRTKKAFAEGLQQAKSRLDASLEDGEAEERLPDGRRGHRGGDPLGQDPVPRLQEGQVPRQDLYHPRPAGSGRLLCPGRLVEPHPAGHHREHRTERADGRNIGRRAPGVVRRALEQRRGHNGGDPSGHRAAHPRLQPLRGLPPGPPRVLPRPQPDRQRVGGGRPRAGRLPHLLRSGSLPERGLPCPDGYRQAVWRRVPVRRRGLGQDLHRLDGHRAAGDPRRQARGVVRPQDGPRRCLGTRASRAGWDTWEAPARACSAAWWSSTTPIWG